MKSQKINYSVHVKNILGNALFMAMAGVVGCTGSTSVLNQEGLDIGKLVGQGLVFGFCPEEFRTVSYVDNDVQLGCLNTPVSSIKCPAGQVLVGIQVVDPGGERKVEPVCSEVQTPSAVPEVTEVGLDTNTTEE